MARALRNELEQREHDIKIIDLFESNKLETFINDKCFLFTQRHIPKLYEKIWLNERKRDPEKRYSCSLQGQIKKVKSNILEKINNYAPDAIICTHFYASALINNLIKENLILGIKTYTILTDYCVHPYWECSYLIDYAFIPHSSVKADLISKGFKENQLIETGIPVHNKFFNKIDKLDARNKVGLSDKFTILILLGGLGLSNPKPVLKSLAKIKDLVNVVVICGRNKKMFNQLSGFVKKNHLESFKIYGFVDFIDTLMDACDITISRGGATSITESLYKNLPIVFREKLYINEKLNEELFIKNNFGIKLEKDSKADELVLKLINEPQILENILKSQKECNKLNTPKIIAEHIEKQNKKHE